MAQQLLLGQGFFIFEASLSHSDTRSHDSSGRMIVPSQRLLPDYTQISHEKHTHTLIGIRTYTPMYITCVPPYNTDLAVYVQLLVCATHTLLRCVIIVVLVSAPVTVMRIEPPIDRSVVGTEVSQVPLSHHPVDVAQFL